MNITLKTLALIAVIVLCLCMGANGKTDTININGTKFVTIKKAVKNEYNGRDTALLFYRVQNGKLKYLLRHFTYRHSADCNNSFTNIGTWKVLHDSLVFETEYRQKTGMDPIPDFRKQIYRVGKDGKLTLLYDKEQPHNSDDWVDTQYKED